MADSSPSMFSSLTTGTAMGVGFAIILIVVIIIMVMILPRPGMRYQALTFNRPGCAGYAPAIAKTPYAPGSGRYIPSKASIEKVESDIFNSDGRVEYTPASRRPSIITTQSFPYRNDRYGVESVIV